MKPAKPAHILHRDREWAQIARLWTSDRPEVALALGRRRVGKTHVLAPFAQAVGGIYYQATRRSEAEQLRALTRLAGERFDDAALRHGAPFESWQAFLRYLVDRAAGAPFLLVLDEYPYLEEAAPGLSSVLQAWIDHEQKGTRVKLILSGSHISAMRRLENADQPLYARRTARLVFAPFTAAEAAAFYPRYEPRDRLLAYGIFGGLPGQLALVEPSLDLATNVVRHVLDPTARLFDEAQHVLDGFHGESEVHYSILSAIARGEHTWKGITSRIGKSSGSLSRPLQWLLDMEVVRRVVPITEDHPQRSKRALYRLADPYLAFWYRFLSPLIQAGIPASQTPEHIWETRIAPRLDEYMGPVFEDVCRAFVERTRSLPFLPERVGAWWDAGSQDEIDVAAIDDGHLLAGECKWGEASAQDVERLRRRATRLAAELGGARHTHLALFTAGEVAEMAGDFLRFDAKALFEPAP